MGKISTERGGQSTSLGEDTGDPGIKGDHENFMHSTRKHWCSELKAKTACTKTEFQKWGVEKSHFQVSLMITLLA